MSEPEPVWSYRGYNLRPGDFTTAMIHLFRAEVTRANAWRQRLDATTNWAVLATAAAISFSFTNGLEYHGVIIINALLVTMFLYIEARRYRYYELWSYRVRLLETDFFAAMVVPPFKPAPDWDENLASTLLNPVFPISMWEAFGRRLRRNYIWIYLILLFTWILKLALFPVGAESGAEFVRRAHVGAMSGWIVISIVFTATALVIAISLLTRDLRNASGEVFPRFGRSPEIDSPAEVIPVKKSPEQQHSWFRHSRKQEQFLVLVITPAGETLAARIESEMQRGVTILQGMRGGETRPVLLCTLTVTEIPHIKSLVSAADPNAVVITTPAQDVLGSILG